MTLNRKSMKRILAMVILLIMLPTAFPTNVMAEERQTPSGLAFDQISSEIEGLANCYTYASFETTVFCGDEDIYTGYFGYADKENGIKADENTVYEWGSVSKTMIWVSAMQLYEQGKLDLEEDIRTYLPEGFFKKLKYDEPITMLDLMNHQGGWQENLYTIQVDDEANITSLGETLQYSEPMQVFHPGEVMSYSNWGATLAAYVVECVSGTEYSTYVRKNILEPLGMEHTSVSPDHRDNPWVREQREKLKSYQITEINGTTIENSLGTNMWFINVYPAGAVTGTISDMAIYAKTFLDEDTPLFQNPETLDELFSASLYFADSEVVRSYHGFMSGQYAVDTIYHNGSTNACSSNLMFDRESGVGVVVLTNQPGEGVFCNKIPELLYGDIMDNPLVDSLGSTQGADLSGVYVQSRGVMSGMLRVIPTISLIPISKDADGEYTVAGEINFQDIGNGFYLLKQEGATPSLVYAKQDGTGVESIQMCGMEMLRSDTVYFELGMVILYILMAVIGVILLIIKLIKKLLKKWKSYEGSLLITISQMARVISIVAVFYMIIQYVSNMGLTKTQGVLFGVLQLICMFIYVLTVVFSAKGMLSKTEKKAKAITYLFAVASNVIAASVLVIFNLFYIWI